jgi:hemerythrin-like metal-binding protein/PAS domain S-box-containing protein/putative nucleotidyltransferase with HDIG domain
MTGIVVFTPFLLVHGMPWVRRFINGERTKSKKRFGFRRLSLHSIGQVISIPVILYITFGIPALGSFEPYYLMAVPLIWIALENGFSKVSLAIVGMNFGIMLAIWLFKVDATHLGELQFLTLGIYASALLTGAIITRQRRTQEELRQSEEKYRDMVYTVNDGIFASNERGILTFANQALARIHGFERPEELVGRTFLEFIAPAMAGNITQLFIESLQGGTASETIEAEIVRPNGTGAFIEIKPVPIVEDGKVTGVRGVVRDITARKQAEEEIKISNDELSMLFELSHSLAEADKLDDILDLVNRHAVESIHTTFARIALFEDGNYIIRAAYPIRAIGNDFGIGERYPVNSISSSPHILEQNEPMILQASDPGISNEEKKVLLLDFAQSLCLIPLRISDSAPNSENLIGLLMLGETRNEAREPFTPEKMRLARTIGDSAAIAIRRMLLREQTERRLQELVALSEIDLAIISSSDMVFSLGVLLLQVLEQLKVDAADIWHFNPVSQALEFVTGHGFRSPAFEKGKPLHLGEGIVGQAAIERRTIHIPDLTAINVHARLKKALVKEPFISYFAVPLIVKGQVKGVLELFHRSELKPNEEWMEFLHTLTNQAAIAIDNSSLFKDLQDSNTELTQAYDATILGWSRALDLRDNETEGHTQRVAEMTTRLGRLFGLSEEDLVQARWGALLHDIGKMGVPDGILLKPGPLTDEEWVVMRKHTTFAFELLSPIHFLRTAVNIPYCHHEKWDGSGYPRGLKGEAIPLPARIFALVDVYDALTSDRPYRKAWPEEKVLEHIRSLSGTHFDPQVVKICLEPGLLKGQSKRRILMEPVQWTEKFSVGVRELDQQHQQLIKLLNRLIATQGTITTHSETISDVLLAMTRYAQVHFKTEERLMEAYGYPGLEEQKMQHRDFRKKTVGFSTATTFGINQVPEDLLTYLTNWLIHHILEDDMAYRSFFIDKGVE